MSFLNFLQAKKIQCPRCLGKGEVDENDIKRLKQELKWGTGTCAYCQGHGKVSAKMTQHVAADCGYLTTDLPLEERTLLIKGDKGAKYRAELFDERIDIFVRHVQYLHFKAKLDVPAIVEFCMIGNPAEDLASEEIKLTDYIHQIIAFIKER